MSGSELKLAFYGDDFTGSSDALEVLAAAGLKCAMFLQPPTFELLQSLGEFDAIGVAGNSRTMSPEEMDDTLPEIFTSLKGLSPKIVHYKVCSTFDSAKDVGSIGHIINMGSKIFDSRAVSVVAGNPVLGRYCIFGNLYALSKTDYSIHRIDRHPIMRSHPITPMYEADLARHINEQKALHFSHVNILDLDDEEKFDIAIRNTENQEVEAILFDGYTNEHLTTIGKFLTELSCESSPIFTVGSSGVEYGLTQYWQSSEKFDESPVLNRNLEPVDQLLVVSGSASLLSALQIEKCIEYGFKEIVVDAKALVNNSKKHSESKRIIEQAVSFLKSGESIVIHTARGSDDKRIKEMLDYLIETGVSPENAKNQGGKDLSTELGLITKCILENYSLKRIILSGGDTSSQVTKTLNPDALVIQSCISPGAPLCKALSDKPFLSELEIALKGGQMGDENYFIGALTGNSCISSD